MSSYLYYVRVAIAGQSGGGPHHSLDVPHEAGHLVVAVGVDGVVHLHSVGCRGGDLALERGLCYHLLGVARDADCELMLRVHGEHLQPGVAADVHQRDGHANFDLKMG